MSGELAVQCTKLPEWLLARRVIPENYAALMHGVDAKVAQALDEAISDTAAQALIKEHRESMTYFVARDIYEAIANSPEGQSKTFLGAHVHTGAAKWKAAVDAYSRKHLGWASEARVLIQNVSYEIPALKKHVASCERQVVECTQRQADLSRLEANARGRYQSILDELGIDGFDPRGELVARAAAELPKIRKELVELVQASGEALVDYYHEFAKHASGSELTDELLPLLRSITRGGDGARVEDLEQAVPALRELREEAARKTPAGGDVAAQEVVTEAAAGAADAEGGNAGDGGIDWGFEVSDGGVGAGGDAGGGINWDFDVSAEGGDAPAESAGASDSGINWGGSDQGGSGGGIDWGGISFEGLDVEVRDQTGVADEDADGPGVLGDRCARELLYQEVAELAAFLRERSADLTSGGSEDYGPPSSQKSLEEVNTFKGVTDQLEELIAGRKTQRLLMLHLSERYRNQQLKRLDICKAQESRSATQRGSLDKVKADQAEEAKKARAEIDKLRAATKGVQKRLEAELTAHFKTGVRIVGEIAQI